MADRIPHPVQVSDRIHASVLRLGVAVLVAYWVDFYTSGRVRTSEEKSYVDFQRSFLIADTYVAVAGVIAAHMMTRGRKEALPVGVAAGSGLTFLGLMDIAYNLQQGKYSERTPEMATEKALNVVSLVLGPLTMVRPWRNRSRFTN